MSGLLETFYFLFTSDAKAMEKGLQESNKQSKNLEDNLNKTDKAAKMLGDNLLKVVKTAAAAAAGMLAFGAVKSMVIDQANLSDQMAKSALQTRMSVENFTAYQRAVQDAGGDANAFAATLERLGERGRNPIQMLSQLRARFQGLNEAQALRLGKMMGLDVGTIELLTKTKAELAAIIAHQKELGVVTKEQAAAARAFNNQLRDTNAVFDDIRRRIATAILPGFTEFLHILERLFIWLRDNKTFTLSFFTAVAGIITTMYLPAVIKATVATYALIAPYLLVAAVVLAVAAAFALLVDDVWAFLHGNDSVIGELSKKWPIVGKTVRAAFEWLKKLPGEIKEGFSKTKEFIIDMAEFLTDTWKRFFEGIANGIGNIKKAWGEIKNVFTPGGAPQAQAGDPAQLQKNMTSMAAQGSAQLSFIAGNPLINTTSSAISNSFAKHSTSNNVEINAPVEIDASGQDPNAIKIALEEHMREAYKSAINHHDDGLAA